MTLNEAKELLSAHDFSFELCEFQNEAEYWHHAMLFPYTKNAKHCKVIAMIIRSQNGTKNIELQFNSVDDLFYFEELRFGDYCFEMFDVREEDLCDDLLNRIGEIKSGTFTVISANNIRRKYWIGTACFDLNGDDAFGKPGFQKAIQHIKRPKRFIAKLLRSKKQFEIYDWNTYQCIIT